jgi:hypothetical protein
MTSESSGCRTIASATMAIYDYGIVASQLKCAASFGGIGQDFEFPGIDLRPGLLRAYPKHQQQDANAA